MLGLVGVTDMDTSVAEVTVSVEDPEIVPEAAEMDVVPAATELANPMEPAVLLMAATEVFEELQATVAVRSCVVLSENVPVAMNCWFVPLTMPGLVGEIAKDTSVAGVTVTVVDPDQFFHHAVIFDLPVQVALAHA